MKRSTIFTLIIGLVAFAALAAANNFRQILAITASAGLGIILVIGLHLPQIVLSALSWQALVANAGNIRWSVFTRLRWIRESINALLPVAQIGGDIVRAKQLMLLGVRASDAVASVTVDLALELSAQIVFGLIGLFLILLSPHRANSVTWLAILIACLTLLAALLLMGQRWGVLRLIERFVPSMALRVGWTAVDAAGLHDSAVAILCSPKRVMLCGSGHLASYFAGALELWASIWALGLHAGWREALVIESLGQIVRTIGFAIPAALGVQEGGFVLLGAMFGIGAQDAIAMSLIRRIREIVLGAPGLIVWRLSNRAPRSSAGVVTGAVP